MNRLKDSIRRKVLARYPYFGGVAGKVTFKEIPGIKEVRNRGTTIEYDPAFFDELDTEEQIFAFARALSHIALEHEARGRGRDKIVWDAAAEAVTNQWLRRDGLEMTRGSLDYPEAIEDDVEAYYEFLLEKKLAIEMVEENMLHQEGDEGTDSTDQEKSPDEWEEDQQDADESEEDPESSEEEALIQVIETEGGNDDSPDVRDLTAIGTKPPTIDWRLILRDSIRHGVDWSMQHAVIEDGIVRPILEELPIPETEIVVDTSWSVDEDLLRTFLRECKNILRLSKIKVGCFDTVFYGFNEIRTYEDIDKMEFPGGGGTDFNVAAEAFTMRADNRIVFTDGEADVPEKILNAIWVVYGDKEIDPPGGTVIHMPVT